VNKGDRIAQLICERIYIPELEEVEVYIYLLYLQVWRLKHKMGAVVIIYRARTTFKLEEEVTSGRS
jgi:hypothetical protein